MNVGVAMETAAGERRVAVVPETLAKLQKAGLEGRSSTGEELQSWLEAKTARVQALVARVGLQKN